MEGSDAQMPQVEMVEEIPGSPTEIAEESDLEAELGTRPKLEKRKRERRRRDPGAVPVPGSDEDEEENESPSKRAPRSSGGLSQPPILGTSSRDMSVR